MGCEIKRGRYAHAEGQTAGCYTHDGKFVITCGSDCSVRLWACSGDDDEDDGPSSITLRESATCIAFNNDVVYIGSGNFVEAYNYPNLKFSERPLRFSAPVTDIDISSDSSVLVAGSCDMKIKLKNMKTNEITELSGHTAPVLKVVLEPNLKFLASSGCDGTVRVWNTLNGETVKTFNGVLPTCNDFFTAKSLGTPAWLKQEKLHLAVVNECKVCFYSANDWSPVFELSHPDIKNLITIISFSECENFLCAGTIGGEIIVWNVKNHQTLSYYEHPKKMTISALSWNPIKAEIACCDRLGYMCVMSIDLSSKRDVSKDAGLIQPSEKLKPAENKSKEFGESEDDENVISINDIKASSGFLSHSEDENNEDEDQEHGSIDDFPSKSMITTDLQPCFQPSSTPSHFEHGYMVWNSIGIVRCFNSENDSSIDVEFHDTMLHHAIHRRNLHNYEMASLSSKILCLASTSKLTGIVLNAWDEKKEWTVDMPEDEVIVALATAGNWVCCATDANQLRFYSYTGMQRQVVSLSGPVVCISGHEGLLIVIIHLGLGLAECQNLGYMLFEISDFFIRALSPCQPLALSPKRKLKWTGFTDEGTPCTYDSAGILRLSRDFLHWEVACDTRLNCKNESDNYFVLGVSERLQCVRCIFCKGSWYPMTVPRPTVVEIPLRIPLCEPKENKTALEDTFWRHIFSLPVLEELSEENDDYMVAVNDWEKLLKQTIIKLFADAYRSKADMRAISIASLMSEQPLEMCIKLVQVEGRTYLVDKLHNINPKDWNDLKKVPTKDVAVMNFSSVPYPNVEHNVISEMKRKNSYKSSQEDMFELSQPTPSTANSLLISEKSNSLRDEKIGSNGSSSKTSMNPFKVHNKEDRGPKGLNFFNNIQQSNTKPSKSDISNTEKIIKTKQTNHPKEKLSDSLTKKIKFVEWYNNQKTSLQSKYPNLSQNELTKIAMKLFREETDAGNQRLRKGLSENDEGNLDNAPESKRRRLEDDNTTVKSSAAEKLSAFNFVK